MDLKAINTIIHDGNTYPPGAVIYDVSDADAKVLIAGGFAAESDEPKVKTAAQIKAEKAAAKAEAEAKEAAEKAAAEQAAAAAASAGTGGEGDGN